MGRVTRQDARPSRFAWMSDARYRAMGETQTVDAMLAVAWCVEAAQGGAQHRLQEARQRIDRLVTLGLPFRWTPEGRAFDLAEVFNFNKSLALDGRDPFWIDRCVWTSRKLVEQFMDEPDRAGRSEARRFTVTLRRTFNLAGLPDKPVRFRLPLPIEDETVRDVTIDDVEAGSLDWRISTDRCRLETRGNRPDGSTLTVAVQTSFTTVNATLQAGADEPSCYLHPSEGHIQLTPRIRRLADDLAGSATSPSQIVASFWSFLLDDLMCGMVRYDQVAAAPSALDWVLDTGWFDCQLGASLLASLCRAKNIPARIVGGYLIYPEMPSYHFWAEVWLDGKGWAPYDLLAWDLSVGGRDPAWRQHFAGALEPRMKTLRMPLRFTGFLGVHFPATWHMLSRRGDRGGETSFHHRDTGALIYRDAVEVKAITKVAWPEPR